MPAEIILRGLLSNCIKTCLTNKKADNQNQLSSVYVLIHVLNKLKLYSVIKPY